MKGDHHSHSDGSCTHMMLFHGGHCEKILWENWMPKTVVEFTLSALAVFFVAFLYEALKFLRQYLLRRELQRIAKDKEQVDPVCHIFNGLKSKQLLKKILAKPHLIQTLLYLIQVTLSMLLMLIFMAFNYWLCLAIILGLTIGYFFFGWIKDDAYDSDCCQ